MNTTRRRFLKSVAVAVGAPMIVPSSIFGNDKKVAANSRINLACIGVGGMGSGNLRSFLQDERIQVVGICDVDANHRKSAANMAKVGGADVVGDFREIIAREDVDAVMIATPDHWHSYITCAAVKAGKDVYCEKPLAASIGEGRIVSDTVRRYGSVLQCGTWRRSGQHTRKACELVRNGYIGDLKSIEVGVPGKFAIRGGFTGTEATQPVPDVLDFDMWQGPAPKAKYTAGRVHFNFRWVDDYAPGYVTDWGAHFLDVAQWGKGSDLSTPVLVEARDVTRRAKGYYDAVEEFAIDYTYDDGVKMTMLSTTDKAKWGVKFIGTKGWVFTENQKLETNPESLRRVRIKDDEVRLYVSNNHHRNFVDCIKSRKETAASFETAHRSASCCHIGAISAAVGSPLEFDPVTERFKGNRKANKMLMRTMRKPWRLS